MPQCFKVLPDLLQKSYDCIHYKLALKTALHLTFDTHLTKL